VTVAGRPCKLTDDLQRRLCDAVAAGNYRRPSCSFVGLGYSTFLTWMAKGKKAARGRFREFRSAVLEAEARCEVGLVAQWKRAMPENVQEIRHFLSRRYPTRWSERGRLELTGRGGGPIRTRQAIESMPDAELHSLINELLGVTAAGGRRNGRAPREALPADGGANGQPGLPGDGGGEDGALLAD
jgi:hypothetical protein